MNKLLNKRILITGASQGLGRELALAFAREGAANLSLVGRNQARLESVRDEVNRESPGTKVTAVIADISRPEEIERAVSVTLDAFAGRLDVLVNNASTLGPVPMPFLLDYPLEDFHRVIDTNLIAPFLLIKSLLPSMIEKGGSIINVTSDAGITGYAGWGAYGISKFGLEGLSQTWTGELEDSGVRVNLVDPGSLNTAMHRDAEPDGDPGEWANPASITGVFVFLASDDSIGITGMRFEAQEDWRKKIKT